MAYQRPNERRPRPSGGAARPSFSKSDRPAGPRTPGRPSGGGNFRPDRGADRFNRDDRPARDFRNDRSSDNFRRDDRPRRFDDNRGGHDQPDFRPVRPARDTRTSGAPMRNAIGKAVPHGQPGERNRKFVKPMPEQRPVRPANYNDPRPPRAEKDDRPGRFDADRPRAYERRDDRERPYGQRNDRRDERPGKPHAKANGNRGFGSDRRDARDRYTANRAADERRQFGWEPERTFRPASDRDFRPNNDRPSRDGDRFGRSNGPAGGERGPRREAPTYNLQRFEKGAARGRRPNDADEPKDGIRLNRYIANAGVCSRREADELIAAGEIRVNGEVVMEMGYIVKPEDSVQYGKRSLKREKLVYVLLNKPKDYITTTEDPEERKTVMDLVGNASKERIFPVGRLDRNTTGLLLFTNDGELAQKLTHPSHRMQKIYQVELDKALTPEHFQQIRNGLTLEDGAVEVDDIAVVNGNERFVGVELHSGRNRVVRRIFEHLGYDVVTLDRVQYAGLTKKDLPRGNWRFLSQQEVIRLKFML